VSGKGGSGRAGGSAGDLYFIVKVRPHPRIQRDGKDLTIEVPVTVSEAVLGASITVPTLQGSIKLKVPPGSQSGQRLRVPGRGAPDPKGGTPGDLYRFYDINPAVVNIARRDFTYLSKSDARIETPLGDARLTLERGPPANLDVLAIDAFSSDAIPVHLITAEALALYAQNIKPDGVIAFHLTNRFLELVPVVHALADARGMQAVWIRDEGTDVLASRSDWVLVSNNRALLAKPRIAEAATEIPPRPDIGVWTDDFNNLFQVLHR